MTLRYMPHLDGLRAVCALVVMGVHFGLVGWFDGEFLAVTAVHCFFVLSGFLITRLLLQGRESASRGRAWASFSLRRVLRLFPLYYATLAVSAAAGVPAVRKHLVWHLTYLTNWRRLDHPKLFPAGHLWSLGVEEQFYLVWPLVVLFLPRSWLLPTFGVCWVTGVATRLAMYAAGAPGPAIYTTTPGSMDFLALGAFLGFAWETGRTEWISRLRVATWAAFAPALAVCLAVGPLAPRFYLTVGGAFSAFVMAMVVDQVARGEHRAVQWLASPVLVGIGRISYGLYVLHRFAQALVKYLMPDAPWAVLVVVATLTSFGLALLSYYALERPALSLRRFLPSDILEVRSP